DVCGDACRERTLLLMCWRCGRLRRTLYGWEAGGQYTKSAEVSDWQCRSCDGHFPVPQRHSRNTVTPPSLTIMACFGMVRTASLQFAARREISRWEMLRKAKV